MQNRDVKELLAVLRENNSPARNDLLHVLGQIAAMERQLDAAVRELAAMRAELAQAKAQNHPAKDVMQKAVNVTHERVSFLREKLGALKESVINGCKSALSAIKEGGISALNNIARFFKVKPILESMQNGLAKGIREDDKAIATITAISTNYHEAGKHIKNIGRAILGKEAIKDAKPVGKVAKAFMVPCKADRACLSSMKKSVETAIGGLTRLEDRAVANRPSVKNDIRELSEIIKQAEKDAPKKERDRTVSNDER